MYLLPLGCLAYLNVRLINSLETIKQRNTRRRRLVVQSDVNDERPRHRDDNVTQCVVAIVCVFIVCQTPALLNQIFWVLIAFEGRSCGKFHFYYTKLSDVLVVLNSSCNFIIYCFFGRAFRRIFLSSLCKMNVCRRYSVSVAYFYLRCVK
jgi:7 transmembrane receptor (rhodopsin family)